MIGLLRWWWQTICLLCSLTALSNKVVFGDKAAGAAASVFYFAGETEKLWTGDDKGLSSEW